MILTEADRDALLGALRSKDPAIVQSRMANAILLLSEGLSVEDVAGLLYLDENLVLGWMKIFQQRQAA